MIRGPDSHGLQKGKEIENYLESNYLKIAIKSTYPSARTESSFLQFDSNLALKTKGGKVTTANKVNIAKFIVDKYPAKFGIIRP